MIQIKIGNVHRRAVRSGYRVTQNQARARACICLASRGDRRTDGSVDPKASSIYSRLHPCEILGVLRQDDTDTGEDGKEKD